MPTVQAKFMHLEGDEKDTAVYQFINYTDEDDLNSNSTTAVATQQSVKAYVDNQGASSTLTGLTDTNVTSPADGSALFYDTGTSKWIDNVFSGAITVADTGVATLANITSLGADGTSITVAGTDKLLLDDNGTTKYVTAEQISDYVTGEIWGWRYKWSYCWRWTFRWRHIR